ncbi:MAG: helix-turn-helix domain-containing protein [Clostridia bacterium]|nr:helix-turn-helix domain-containing protein [Clostridia bacterium]
MISLICKGEKSIDERIEQEIDNLDNLKIEQFRENVEKIVVLLDEISDPIRRKSLTRQLFLKTSSRDEESHMFLLAYPQIYTDSLRQIYLAEALKLAKKLKLEKQRIWVEDQRSNFFIKTMQYDSAMVSILNMRDYYETQEDEEEKMNLYHLLGDVYYHARLFDKAQDTYLAILDHYNNRSTWNFWRPYVIMNNLGQIGLLTHNYQMALDWFNKSLTKANNYLKRPYHVNIKAYINIKTSETYLLMGDLANARRFFENIEKLPFDKIRADSRAELTYLRSHLLFKEGKYEEALKSAIKNNNTKPKWFLLLSRIYDKLNKPKKSLYLLKQYHVINDSINKQNNINRSLIILAENDHEKTRQKLILSKKENIFLIASILTLLTVSMIILILYWKLYFSKVKLVRKTLENEKKIKHYSSKPKALKPLDNEVSKFYDLASRLQTLIEKDKIYLDPELTIEKVATNLGTNRSYLSRTVNTVYETNFPNFINEFRIQEVIRLISEGYAVTHTLETLANNSGFNNRSVFINAFKKYTGVTPSFFINNQPKHQVK